MTYIEFSLTSCDGLARADGVLLMFGFLIRRDEYGLCQATHAIKFTTRVLPIASTILGAGEGFWDAAFCAKSGAMGAVNCGIVALNGAVGTLKKDEILFIDFGGSRPSPGFPVECGELEQNRKSPTFAHRALGTPQDQRRKPGPPPLPVT